jgi:O-antigen/teichoic acid export membrane protein
MAESHFVRTSVALITIELTTKLLGLVLFVFMARFLGITELGVYAFALALANLFVIAPKFGFDRLAQKEVGRDSRLLYALFCEISLLKVILSLGALTLLYVLLLALGESHFLTVLLIACFVFVYSFLEFLIALFRAIQRPTLEIAVRTLFSVANLSLGLIALYAGWGLNGFVMTQIISVGAAVLLGCFIVERTAIKVPYSREKRALWRHVTATAPFAGILLALYFSNQIGIVLLPAFAGKEQVGYFAAASRLFDNLTLIPAAIMGAFLPTMSRLYITSVGTFVHTMRFTLKYLLILSLPIAAGLFILAHPITIFLYGESFAPSASALRILSVALIFSFWNYAGDNVLIASNRERLLLQLTWLDAVIHVSASLLLIPSFSYLGLCWAVLTTQGVQTFILLAVLRRYFNARTLWHLIAAPVLCTAVMSVAVSVMRDWNLQLLVPVGMAVYTIALLASGTVQQSEVNRLQGMMRSRLSPSLLEP